MLAWWIFARMVPGLGVVRTAQPVRWALGVFVFFVLVSYVSGHLHGWAFPVGTSEPTTPATPDFPENVAQVVSKATSGSDRGLVSLAAWCGPLVVITDGLEGLRQVETLLRRLVYAVAAMAALGVLQFFTKIDIAAKVHIPGLTANQPIGGVFTRSDFNRVSATAIHPIEFGVVVASCLPLALHFALHAPQNRKLVAWVCAGLIAVAIPMSVSKSAILVAAVGLLVLFVAWPRPRQLLGLILFPFFAVGMRVLIPGLLGTVTSLFTHIFSDPSTGGRTDDYSVAFRLVREAPLFGHGLFTFLPTIYDRFLDNQWLDSLIELGYVGTAAFLMLFVVGFFSARGARRYTDVAETRHLAQALAGGVAGLVVAYATFDALSFPMATGVTFTLLGGCGAIWRVSRLPEQRTGSTGGTQRVVQPPRAPFEPSAGRASLESAESQRSGSVA
jgi:hypothetical protein